MIDTWKFTMEDCEVKTDHFQERSTNLMILATDKNVSSGTVKARPDQIIKPKGGNRNSSQGGRNMKRGGGGGQRGGHAGMSRGRH